MPELRDIADETELARVRLIGAAAMDERKVVGFFIDEEGTDGFAKADRYIAKLKEIWPAIHISYKGKFEDVPNVVLVKVGPPVN